MTFQAICFGLFNRSKSIDNKNLILDQFSKISLNNDERIIGRIVIEKKMGNHFLVSTFENDRKKKPNLIVNFELIESDFPLQKIRFMDMNQNVHNKVYEALLKVLPNTFYRIKTVKSDSKNGVIMYNEFDCSKERTDFDVTKFLKKTTS